MALESQHRIKIKKKMLPDTTPIKNMAIGPSPYEGPSPDFGSDV